MYKIYVKKYWRGGASLKATLPGVFSMTQTLKLCQELEQKLTANPNHFGYHGETMTEIGYTLVNLPD